MIGLVIRAVAMILVVLVGIGLFLWYNFDQKEPASALGVLITAIVMVVVIGHWHPERRSDDPHF